VIEGFAHNRGGKAVRQSISERAKCGQSQAGSEPRGLSANRNAAVLLLLVLGCFVACEVETDLVATYCGGILTEEELERRILTLPEGRRGPSEGGDVREWEERVAKQIVLERILVPEERYLPLVGTMLRPGPWRRLLAQEIIGREGTRTVEVPDDSVTSYYERNWSRFFIPEGVVFHHVFLAIDEGTTERQRARVRARADSILALARSGADFEELVERYSESESRGWQGKVGTMFRGQLPAPIEKVVYSLGEGEVGGPIATEYGYHVVKVTERKPEQYRSLEEVAPTIRHELRMAALASMREAFLVELQEEIPIRLDTEAFFGPGPDTAVVLGVAGESATRADVTELLRGLRKDQVTEEELREALMVAGREAQLYRKALDGGLAEDPVVVERYQSWIGGALVDSLLGRKLEETEPEEDVLRSHFEEHSMRYSKPKTWRAREILITGLEGERYQAWRRANDVVERIRAGEGFPAMASELSSAPSAENGGDLGEMAIREAALRGPEFQKALFSLGVGEVSDVVRTDAGYLILKLEGISEPAERDFEEVMELVREDYVSKQRATLMEGLASERLEEVGFVFVRGPE
jgi:parvulin-like peptidyl-prolyl isomerase